MSLNDLHPSPDRMRELQRLLDQAHKDHRRNLDALRETAADELEVVLSRDPMDAKDLIAQYARDASQMANDYYDTLRTLWAEYGDADFPTFDHTALIDPDRTLWQVQGGFNDSDFAGLTYQEVAERRSRARKHIEDLWPDLSNLDDAQQFIAEMIAASERLTLQRNMRLDPTKPRWARVPAGPTTCAFCLMLASRGFAYLSEESAGLGNSYHPHCDCRIVPSWGKQHLAGFNPDRYRRMWDSTGSGEYRERLARMRTMYPDQLKDGVATDRTRTAWKDERRILSLQNEKPHPQSVWDARQRKLGIPTSKDVLEMHEIVFLERFAKLGNHYRWIPKDRRKFLPTNDFHWNEQDGDYELKSMQTAKYSHIAKRISEAASKAARKGVTKDSFIIDLGDTEVPDKLINQLALYNQRSQTPIKRLWILSKSGLKEVRLKK